MVSTELIDRIVHALNESEEGPRQRIVEILEAVGESTALELLEETQRIESAGGELVKKGSRKRTPGGVFFRLAKARMAPEARRQIFRSPHKSKPGNGPDLSDDMDDSTPAPKPPVTIVRRPSLPDRAATTSLGAGARPATTSPDAGARPRRRVIELGSVRKPEASQAPEPGTGKAKEPSRMVWTKPSQARSTSIPQQVEEPRAYVPAHGKGSPVRAAAKPSDVLEQLRAVVRPLGKEAAIGALLELLAELGYAAPEKEPESSRRPLETKSAAKAPKEESAEERRERVLCSVVTALGLGARELAAVLYRDDSASAIRKAEQVLKRRSD